MGIGIFGGERPFRSRASDIDVLLPGMFATLSGLFFFHGKQREAERERRMQYWQEQVWTTDRAVLSQKTYDRICRPLSVRTSYRGWKLRGIQFCLKVL